MDFVVKRYVGGWKYFLCFNFEMDFNFGFFGGFYFKGDRVCYKGDFFGFFDNFEIYMYLWMIVLLMDSGCVWVFLSRKDCFFMLGVVINW